MDTTNHNTALASALVEELARSGVRRAAICPGSRSAPLALALLREPRITTTTIVDERSAGFFALGAAQASGEPVAVLTTSGTAAANLHPAVSEADQASIPLLVLTADRPPELRGIGAGQTIDQLKLYGDAVRWFCELGTHEADDAGLLHHRAVACRAVAAALGDPRPGPVHLNCAWREPLAPEPRPGEITAGSGLALRGRDPDRPLTTVPRPPLGAPPQLVEALAERIAAEPRGIVVAGRIAGPAAAQASRAAAIAALARAAGYPILAEPTSGLRLGRHDRGLVCAAYEPIARLRPAELAPGLVIRFGELPTCKPLRQWLAELESAPQLVVDPSGAWNDPGRHAGAILRADPAALAGGVAERLGDRATDERWARSWLAAERAAAEAIAAELAAIAEPTEPGLHAELGRLYADGDLVYTASSMPIRDQEAFLSPGEAEVALLANRGANGIDGLISSGLGAAAATGRRTWIVTGDLGLFHDMNALAILRDLDPAVRIIVANNDGGGIFEFLPQANVVEREEFEALFGTPLGLDLERVAALYRLPFARLETLGELAAATERATLIEVPLDRRANVAVHRRLHDAAAAAVGAALA